MRVHVLLRREGWDANPKRTYRLYKELGLQLCSKLAKRRVKAKLRADLTITAMTNQFWAMDFVHNQLATGRKPRILTIVDTFSRYSPVVDTPLNYRGEDVALVFGKGLPPGWLSPVDPGPPGRRVHLRHPDI
jgi:putative transposase